MALALSNGARERAARPLIAVNGDDNARQPAPRRTKSNSWKPINPETIKEILRRRAEGKTVAVIAEEMNIKPTSVSYVVYQKGKEMARK